MKIIIQRVSQGSVSINRRITGKIGPGYVVLLGVKDGDTEKDAHFLAKKTVNLRVFSDDDGLMNQSIQDINGEILVVSQFTLYADTRKGNRPSFSKAAKPEIAETLYESYVSELRSKLGESRVATGEFGAMMNVELINEGPVTIEISTDQ
jgi:D-tyrosyl-tRNA(Tyr) deacylase